MNMKEKFYEVMSDELEIAYDKMSEKMQADYFDGFSELQYYLDTKRTEAGNERSKTTTSH